jgi:hypothetical protein
MPAGQEAARGGAVRYRTIRAGKGKNRRYLRVAIVRKRGKRGGQTIAGKPHAYKEAR